MRISLKTTGKGVIVSIWPDAKMPVDKYGTRAEVIVDGDSTIKRMNIGRLYEQYINAVGAHVTRTLPVRLGSRSPAEIDKAWDYLMYFYKTVSPVMYKHLMASDTVHRKLEHLEEVIRDGHYLYVPNNSPANYLNVVRKLNKWVAAIVGPVSYIGNSGVRCTTKSSILIGNMYFLLLEKTGNTWAGVSSAKLQHFGIPAKLTNEDKYSAPGRAQPVRILGESEVRLFAATVGGDVVADLLDQTNNPIVHKEILNQILHADKPSNIDCVVDRQKFPVGQGRMHLYVNHVLECAGAKFERRRDPK